MSNTDNAPTKSELRDEYKERQAEIFDSAKVMNAATQNLVAPLAEALLEIFKDDERVRSLHEPFKRYSDAKEKVEQLREAQRATLNKFWETLDKDTDPGI